MCKYHGVGHTMDSADTRVFSVIVKIWVEDSGKPTWHGRVTHIPSGEQYYVRRVEDIAEIVCRYLSAIGLKVGIYTRMWRWLQRITP